VPWKPVAWLAGATMARLAVAGALRVPLLWAEYPTAQPEALFRTSTLVVVAISVLLQGAMVVLALGTLAACFPAARALTQPAARRSVAGSSIAAALTLLGALLMVDGIAAFALARFPRAFSDAPISIPTAAATALPAVAGLGGRLFLAVLLLTLAGLAIHRWHELRQGWVRALFVIAALAALLPSGVDASTPELAAGVMRAVVVLVAAVLLLRVAFAGNPVAFVLATVWLATAAASAPFIRQPGGFYAYSGWALLAIVAAASLAWLWRGPRDERQDLSLPG
jgi:hypothetical protein